MSFLSVENVKIVGMAACLPKTVEENISLKEACVKLGFMTPEEFDNVFHPEQMV